VYSLTIEMLSSSNISHWLRCGVELSPRLEMDDSQVSMPVVKRIELTSLRSIWAVRGTVRSDASLSVLIANRYQTTVQERHGYTYRLDASSGLSVSTSSGLYCAAKELAVTAFMDRPFEVMDSGSRLGI
jgi:hypothetical protein